MRIEACVVRGLNKELTENLRTPPPVWAEGTLLDLRTNHPRNPATAHAHGPSVAAVPSLRSSLHPNPEAQRPWASCTCSLGAPRPSLCLAWPAFPQQPGQEAPAGPLALWPAPLGMRRARGRGGLLPSRGPCLQSSWRTRQDRAWTNMERPQPQKSQISKHPPPWHFSL